MARDLSILATGDIFIGMPDDHPKIPNVLPGATMEPLCVPAEKAQPYVSLMTALSKKYGTTFSIEGDEVLINGA